MAAFLAGHRADDGRLVHDLGHVRKVLADFDAGDRRADGLGLAAVVVARLGAEGFELAGPPCIHSRMQAMPRFCSSPASSATRSRQLSVPAAMLAARNAAQEIAAANRAVAADRHVHLTT